MLWIGMLIVLWFLLFKKFGRISDWRQILKNKSSHSNWKRGKLFKYLANISEVGAGEEGKSMVVYGGAITHLELKYLKSSQVQILKEREQTIVHRNWMGQAKSQAFSFCNQKLLLTFFQLRANEKNQRVKDEQ